MSDCPITGEAIVDRDHIGRMRWHKTDPEIHAATELLNNLDDAGRTFFNAKYEIGEPCPYQPHTVHARLWKAP